MVQETEKVAETKASVLEQRVKPTVIRRRAKKVEEAPPPSEAAPEEAGGASAVPAAAQAATEAAPSSATVAAAAAAAASAAAATQPAGAPVPGESKPGKPTVAERKIGVVGYINLGAPGPMISKVKEDWRDRLKRGPKRRKSQAELELEAIQKAGGLRQYAGQALEDTVVPAEAEAASVAAVGERVFQPVPSGRRRKARSREFKKTVITAPKAIKKVIRIEDGISVSGLSQSVGIKASDIIQKLMALGIMATINQQIDVETASLIAGEFGFTVEHTAFKEEDVLVEPAAKVSVENQAHRAPVVTVMGHVDHGKTSILDVIRKTKVAAGEAGGITQHIGAYEVEVPKGKLTFLDTPGHAAFTTMRARGAQATDIVVLVVAADDGIMPQTVEAIDHARAAEVPIVVAINKIDKSNALPDRVKKGLSEQGLVPEDWGGDTICVLTSAKTGEGIDHLLEMILLQAEVLELTADPTLRPKGLVIESRLDRGRGPVATVLVQEGTLKVGNYVVCGTYDGKVRAMFDAAGQPIDEAGPSKPAEILGLSGVPSAGDEMIGVTDERGAKFIAEQRRDKERTRQLTGPIHVSLEDLAARLAVSETKELNIILKVDVQGSLDAVSDALIKLSTDQVKLTILHSGVGGITENDVMLASASDAVVFGFNVMPDGMAKEAAGREGVDVHSYRIIYEMIDEVKKAMEGLLAPNEKEVWLGRAEVKEVFRVSKVGAIAGCQVSSGKIQRNARVRLIRDQAIVFEGTISSLKRFKDDAREVAEGYECGIGIEKFGDIKQGDAIEAYIIEKTAARL
ncbi:MAG: translation initiation factor IF-2 [Pseudomonadota bacterium]